MTRGEWHVDPVWGRRILNEREQVIATCSNYRLPSKEMQANIRKMVAAPILLAAAEGAVNCNHALDGRICSDCEDALRVAISRMKD